MNITFVYETMMAVGGLHRNFILLFILKISLKLLKKLEMSNFLLKPAYIVLYCICTSIYLNIHIISVFC